MASCLSILLRILLLATILSTSGCLGLIRAILYPAEAAKAAGAELAYNVAQDLAGGDAANLAFAQESLDNVERILRDHPDAANRSSLERLRDHLREEVGVSDEISTNDDLDRLDTLDDDEVDYSQLYPTKVERNEHDRHQADFLDQNAIPGAVNDPNQVDQRRMKTSITVEDPREPVRKLRQTDGRYFATVPRSSVIRQPEPDFPMIYLEGDRVHQAPMDQGLLNGGRIVERDYFPNSIDNSPTTSRQ